MGACKGMDQKAYDDRLNAHDQGPPRRRPAATIRGGST